MLEWESTSSPTMFINSSNFPISTRTVRLKLYKGNCMVVGRKAPKSLYNPKLATFEAESVYNQKDAEGFIKLNALRLKANKSLRGRNV